MPPKRPDLAPPGQPPSTPSASVAASTSLNASPETERRPPSELSEGSAASTPSGSAPANPPPPTYAMLPPSSVCAHASSSFDCAPSMNTPRRGLATGHKFPAEGNYSWIVSRFAVGYCVYGFKIFHNKVDIFLVEIVHAQAAFQCLRCYSHSNMSSGTLQDCMSNRSHLQSRCSRIHICMREQPVTNKQAASLWNCPMECHITMQLRVQSAVQRYFHIAFVPQQRSPTPVREHLARLSIIHQSILQVYLS